MPSVTRLSCALTHPGWNNDIPHHVIQPPRCLLAPSSRPLGSHIPGQRRSRPRHCPGGATFGLCWCQGKRIRSVPRGADVIHERCSAREPRARSAPRIAHQKAGKRRRRERRELYPNAEPGATGRGLLPLPLGKDFSSLPGAMVGLLASCWASRVDSMTSEVFSNFVDSVLFQACLPRSTALDLGFLGEKVPPHRATPCPGGKPLKRSPPT